MRITRDLLHEFAEETVRSRKRSEPDLLAAYLTGSALSEHPLLGGTTDIDLILVHKFQIPTPRETEAVTREVSLDIRHVLKDDFAAYRQLRYDPWLGYPLTHPNIILFDTDHWLEFIQSGVSADFHRGDIVMARVNPLMREARSSWFPLRQAPPEAHQAWLDRYLHILALAANAVAGLIGAPLTTRRFLLTFTDRIQTLGTPQILAGFSGLLGQSPESDLPLGDALAAFEADYAALVKTGSAPPKLAACRQPYYGDAIRAMTASDTAAHAVWPLTRTWLDVRLAAGSSLPGEAAWDEWLAALQLTPASAKEKTAALDAYLDTVDIILEAWAENYG